VTREAQRNIRTETVLPARTPIGDWVLVADLPVTVYERRWLPQAFHAYVVLPDGYEAQGHGSSPAHALDTLAVSIRDRLRCVAKGYAEWKSDHDGLMALLGAPAGVGGGAGGG
jgi:hypothetical protein